MSEAWSVVIKVHSFDSKAEAKKFAIEAACTFQTIPGSKDLATSIKFEPNELGGEWQPIATAPKDGTAILLFGGEPDEHSWRPALPQKRPAPCVVAWWESDRANYYGNGWRFAAYDSGHYGEWVDPEFWMPLPSPPASPGPEMPQSES